MKFGEQLKESLVPEWASQYMDYDQLKNIIDQIIVNNTDVSAQQRLAEHFKFIFDKNLDKVSEFHCTILEKQDQLVHELFSQVQLIVGTRNQTKYQSSISFNCQEVFKSLNMVQSYGSVNAIGFRKIYKKYKKNATISLDLDIDTILQDSRINNNNQIDDLQKKLTIAFMNLHNLPDLKTSRKLLQQYHQTTQNINKIRNKSSSKFGFLLGISAIFFLAYLDIQLVENTLYEIPDIVQLTLRFFLMFFVLLLGFAIMISIFEVRKINYIFILELPTAKITSGYRKIYSVSFFILFCVSLLGVLATTSSITQPQYKVPLPFTDSLSPFFWVGIPFYFLIMMSFYQIIRIQTGHSQIARFVYIVSYKLLTPWIHRVTFPVFFSADVATSMTGIIADFITIMSLNLAPDWFVFICVNIPNLIRIVQQIVRYIDSRQAYPHILNLFKYLVSIPSNLILINAISNHQVGYWIIITNRCVETIFKLYWDTFEDFSCFTGGVGGRTFKNNQEKWKNKILLRRPSSFQTYQVVIILIFNFFARLTWLIPVFYKSETTSHVWYGSWVQACEILRRFSWALLRLDNQQATNCEDLLATRYVPVLLSVNERMEIKSAVINNQDNNDYHKLTRADTMTVNDDPVNQLKQHRISLQQY